MKKPQKQCRSFVHLPPLSPPGLSHVRNLSHEIEKKREYARDRYKNTSDEKKQKRKQSLRNYFKVKNNKLNDW